jgi:hypothetical protein
MGGRKGGSPPSGGGFCLSGAISPPSGASLTPSMEHPAPSMEHPGRNGGGPKSRKTLQHRQTGAAPAARLPGCPAARLPGGLGGRGECGVEMSWTALTILAET